MMTKEGFELAYYLSRGRLRCGENLTLLLKSGNENGLPNIRRKKLKDRIKIVCFK